jgi:hypothetical protein
MWRSKVKDAVTGKTAAVANCDTKKEARKIAESYANESNTTYGWRLIPEKPEKVED